MIGYTGWAIPEGNVVEVADESGRVIWAVSGGKVVLEVARFNVKEDARGNGSDGNYISLAIYPKTNGTVKVTYGGLTKNIIDTSGVAEPNAQNVMFGALPYDSDDGTPASGTLTIEGDVRAVGCGTYSVKESGTSSPETYTCYVHCVTEIVSLDGVEIIPDKAFGYGHSSGQRSTECPITSVTIPKSVVRIGQYAFGKSLANMTVLATTPPTAFYAFTNCTALATITVPKGCGNAYKAAPDWSNYADRIVEAS